MPQINNLEKKLPDETPINCPHKEYCPLPKYSMKCIFGRNDCKSFKFYKKYGEMWNQLGVGS